MIRLKDIAEKAGVSVMTVSKALRNEPDIAKATRTRIRAIADQTGYVPNHAARGLRLRRLRADLLEELSLSGHASPLLDVERTIGPPRSCFNLRAPL